MPGQGDRLDATLRAAWLSALLTGAAAAALPPVTAPGALGGLLTAAALGLPLALLPTTVRVLAHPRRGRPPVPTARAVVAGVTATGLFGAAVTAASLGLLATAGPPSSPLVWILTAAVAAGTALSLVTAAAARRAWAGEFARLAVLPSAARPDLVDDAATLVARWWPGSLPARLAAWFVAGLDRWTLSPRRHRTGFVVGAGAAGGVALASWHATVAGSWGDVTGGVAFTVASAAVVAGALAAGIGWLGLLRPVARTS